MNKNIIIGAAVAVFIAILAWLFIASIKPSGPLPGQQIEDLGREHVTDISSISYNSNPPTSGTHFPVWAKRGVYDRVISDGHLIHSLEHGYIVLSYNCEIAPQARLFGIKEAKAHLGEPIEIHDVATGSAQPFMQMKVGLTGEMSGFTPENAPEKEVELAESFNSEECKTLVNDLSQFLNDFQRIIIVPRPTLDERIAITAWNRIEKFNQFDKERIKRFIEAYHNKGPERTME